MEKQAHNQPHSLSRRLIDLAGGLPYGAVSRVLSMLLGNPLMQRTLFRKRRRQLQRMRGLIGCTGNAARDLARHLSGLYSMPWRVNALSRLDAGAFRAWVRIENEQVLTDLKAASSPALLVSCHTAISRLTPLVLVRLGHDIATLEPEPYLQRMGARGAEQIQSITLRGEGEKFWMKEMFQSKKVLDEKRMLHLALDGHQGTGGIEHAFLGRKRIFHLGLAKMAIQMSIPIVLVRSTLDEDGHVNLVFIGPLDVGDAVQPEEVRVKRFLDQYVDMIETIWRNDLGNVSPRHLPPHLRAEPVADSKAASGLQTKEIAA